MSTVDRRSFLQSLAAAGAAGALPESIKRALAIEPAAVTGTIMDVQHIVILMQENRSFDHYFGRLRGVRGFGDPRAVKLSNGNSVFQQPNQNSAGVTQTPNPIVPFRPVATPSGSTTPLPNLGLAFLADLAHGWRDAHLAWNNGNNDMWTRAKNSRNSMAYMDRQDIPYFYALADAFTICDAYFCSTMTSTDPNRYYMWTGWLGQNGSANPDSPNTGSTPGIVNLASSGNGVPPLGPVITNAEVGYNWHTYPERLQAAGVTWKIYQDQGHSLDAAGSWGWIGNKPYIGNYGDNSILYFNQYRNASPGDPLYEGARRGTEIYDLATNTFTGATLFDQIRADVLANTLPQVSWITAPEAYTEHPNWPANYGAWYISNVLSALTANPASWASTVFIVCYDENDGFFDHVVAPTPPVDATGSQGKSTVDTVNEIYPGIGTNLKGPYGLGARVPMLILSPWSKGGWVNSEVFDATSLIRFIEQRFGVIEPNITPWRRAVCGDLRSCFDFSLPISKTSPIPSTTAYAPPTADIIAERTYGNASQALPAGTLAVPTQERGIKPARKLAYRLQADGNVNATNGTIALTFTNSGTIGAWYHVRTANGSVAGGSAGPWGYTVEAGKSLADTWTGQGGGAAYMLAVYGPKGFFRNFEGSIGGSAANLSVQTIYTAAGGLQLVVTNLGTTATTVTVTDVYTGAFSQQVVAPSTAYTTNWDLAITRGWYDLSIRASTDAGFVRQVAGYVETSSHGITDPYLA